MGLTAKASGADRIPIPEGVYMAVCYAVYDLGTHHNPRFNKDAHKCMICWEIPDERISIERDGVQMDLPRAVSQRYTVSLHEKASLRHDLEAWRGRSFSEEELAGFDLKNILGKTCQVQIIHNIGQDGKVWENVAAVMALPKGVKKLKSENELRFFSFEDDLDDIPDDVPEWIAKLMKQSSEYQAMEQAAGLSGQAVDQGADDRPPYNEDLIPEDEDDDIPF